jgi:hypothetical protein
MAVAVVPREDNAFANDNPPPARNVDCRLGCGSCGSNYRSRLRA